MKTLGLVLLMLGCAAWPVRAVYARQAAAPPQQAAPRNAADEGGNHAREADHGAPADAAPRAGKISDAQRNQRKVSGTKSPASNPSARRSNHSNEAAHSRERSASGDFKNSQRGGSVKAAGATENGLARNETTNHTTSNRVPSAAKPAVPALSTVRHRGANPAIVGGAGNSNSRNTMALDGTHMSRKRAGN